ncbi:YcaO-like family protein [Inquilinus limosus]|uniref:YcaO-like family protein n=1 Tax=Inquilinus limosus TaxID=171674 RepID=UPI003F16A734
MIPVERSQTLDEAYARIAAFIYNRGWSSHISVQGTGLVTSHCVLRDHDGGVLANGLGKGALDESVVGAMYEAVEHYYSDMETMHSPFFLVPAEEMARADGMKNLPFYEALSSQRADLACRRMKSFFSESYRFMPLFMLTPDYGVSIAAIPGDTFDYSSVTRYSNNGGTAIGKSFAEACVHALNELIERDAVSLFMLQHFVSPHRDCSAQLIEPETLPATLLADYRSAEDRVGQPVILLDVTTDIGVPSFVATTTTRGAGETVHPYGAGSSLSPAHAAHRAYAELVQISDARRRSDRRLVEDHVALRMLEPYPRLSAAARFQVDTKVLPFQAWGAQVEIDRGPERMLEIILERLTERGVDACFSVNFEECGTCCVVSCVSTLLERFHLVSAGHVVVPGRRGLALLADSLPSGCLTGTV